MPPSETRSPQRGGTVFTVLFWAGVSLAPLAALMLLVGQGEGPLRIAAVLAIIAVVLIGLSITLRKDTETVRLEMEETLLDEVDILREDVRQDIAAAARAQHRQFSEKLQTLYESIEALRGQVDSGAHGYGRAPEPSGQFAAGQYAAGQFASGQFPAGQYGAGQPADGRAAAGGPTPAGRVSGSATVGPGRPTPAGHAASGQAASGHAAGYAAAGQTAPGHAAGGYAASGYAAPGHAAPGGHATGHARASSGHAGAGHVGAAHAGAASMPPPAPPPGPQLGGGVVRHTETVQVTTRSTIVDQHGADSHPGRGTVYGGSTTYGHTSEPPRSSEWREPAEESWTEQRLRERLGGFEGRGFEPRDGRRPRPYERDDGPAPDDRWAGMRAGDRWTSVRTDDRGREMHMGERRAAMQSDDTGTELRVEDRWASMRRDEPRRWSAPAEERWSTEDRWAPDAEDTGQSEWSGWLSGDRDRRAAPAALPSTSAEPSWSESWEDQPRAGRRRQREDGDAYSWRAELDEPQPQPARVRQRRLDFELSDDRWG